MLNIICKVIQDIDFIHVKLSKCSSCYCGLFGYLFDKFFFKIDSVPKQAA